MIIPRKEASFRMPFLGLPHEMILKRGSFQPHLGLFKLHYSNLRLTNLISNHVIWTATTYILLHQPYNLLSNRGCVMCVYSSLDTYTSTDSYVPHHWNTIYLNDVVSHEYHPQTHVCLMSTPTWCVVLAVKGACRYVMTRSLGFSHKNNKIEGLSIDVYVATVQSTLLLFARRAVPEPSELGSPY